MVILKKVKFNMKSIFNFINKLWLFRAAMYFILFLLLLFLNCKFNLIWGANKSCLMLSLRLSFCISESRNVKYTVNPRKPGARAESVPR